MKDKDFAIILSKNRLARELKGLYEKAKEPVPTFVKVDFDEIEKKTGTANQPTGREILESKQNI